MHKKNLLITSGVVAMIVISASLIRFTFFPQSSALSADYYLNAEWRGIPWKRNMLDTKISHDGQLFQDALRAAPDGKISVEWRGYFFSERGDQRFKFWIQSDAGAWLWIDDQLVIENDKNRDEEGMLGRIEIATGWHAIRLRYQHTDGNELLNVLWEQQDAQQIPFTQDTAHFRPDSKANRLGNWYDRHHNRLWQWIWVGIVGMFGVMLLLSYFQIIPFPSQIRSKTMVFIVLLLIAYLSSIGYFMIVRAEVKKDQSMIALQAFHLWTTGQLSFDGVTPTNIQEPVPLAANALYMAWLTDLPKTATKEQVLISLYYTRQLKKLNLLYAIISFFVIWLLCWQLTRSHLVSSLAIYGSGIMFFLNPSYMQNIYYEFIAALLILGAAAASVLFARRHTVPAAILTGFLWGLLSLTKAVGLYISYVAIPLLAVSLFFFKSASFKRTGILCAALALSYAGTVTPWMLRNYVHFHEFSICQRGGSVLLTRAHKNLMTRKEYYGTVYAYAPSPVRRLLEIPFGFAPQDLETGGKYQRLFRFHPGDRKAISEGDPDAAISYFAKSVALKTKLVRDLEAHGKTYQDANALFQKTALEMIKAAPLKHLKAIPVFAYRGIWSSYNPVGESITLIGMVGCVIDLAAFFALFMMPLAAIVAKKTGVVRLLAVWGRILLVLCVLYTLYPALFCRTHPVNAGRVTDVVT